MNDRDLDAEFQRIVAGWDDEALEPVDRAPAGMPSGEDPLPGPDVIGSDTAIADGGTSSDGGVGSEGPLDGRLDGDADVDAVDPAPDASFDAPVDTGGSRPDGAGPAPTDVALGAGGLGLPIASTTSHVWRASTPSDAVDDVDAVLDEAAAARGEPDDHFVPPSEIELPSAETDPMFWAIVGGLVGGPLLLLYLLFFDRDGSGWWVVMALTMVVGGFVLLVLRGGNERDPFDDGTRV